MKLNTLKFEAVIRPIKFKIMLFSTILVGYEQEL